MFLRYLPVVFLLAAAAKGTTMTESQNISSSHTTSSFTTSTAEHFTSSVLSTSRENDTTESASVRSATTHAETTYQSSTESRTTTDTVDSTETENSNFNRSTTDSPSSPTSGTVTSTANPETNQPNNAIETTTLTTTSPITVITSLRPTEITNNSTAAPPIPTVGPVIVCPSIPCPLDSVCLNGTCQCLSGSFLLNGRCTSGRVFPGRLHLTSLVFTNEMFNRSSSKFQQTAAEISAALREALMNQPGYIRSDVVQLQPGSVLATVNNIFDRTAGSQESVDQSINEAIAKSNNTQGLLTDATFAVTNLCEQSPLPCDVSTTTCSNTKGQAACSCKEGFISIVYSNTSCKACPSGQRAEGDVCKPCSFGYAGFNCNDSALLAVVVISCVLGGILLILVLALLIYCCWTRCSKSKPDYNSSPYSSGDANQPWPTGITPIPRANTNWDTAPPIEMTEGGSTHDLMDKKHENNGLSGSYDLNPDGMRTFKGKNPSRYSYLVQGHENPYFLPGDENKN